MEFTKKPTTIKPLLIGVKAFIRATKMVHSLLFVQSGHANKAIRQQIF